MPKTQVFENTSAFIRSLPPDICVRLTEHFEDQFGVSRSDFHFMIDHRNDAVVVVTAVPKKPDGGSS